MPEYAIVTKRVSSGKGGSVVSFKASFGAMSARFKDAATHEEAARKLSVQMGLVYDFLASGWLDADEIARVHIPVTNEGDSE